MWHLQDHAGTTVVSGSGPVAWSAARRGWETPNTCYADPDHSLRLVDLPGDIAALVAQIDADVDAIYGVVIGNRQAEYEAAERQAQAFADAEYIGEVPAMVASWATAKGWTAQQAADDILQVSGQWRGAQEQIRAQRLLRKEQARAAETAQALAGVRAAWAAFVAFVRGQLGLGAA